MHTESASSITLSRRREIAEWFENVVKAELHRLAVSGVYLVPVPRRQTVEKLENRSDGRWIFLRQNE